MATYNQRALAIVEAFLNGPSTADQRQKVIEAFGSSEAFVLELFNYTKTKIRRRRSQASEQTVNAAVDAEFPEQPG